MRSLFIILILMLSPVQFPITTIGTQEAKGLVLRTSNISVDNNIMKIMSQNTILELDLNNFGRIKSLGNRVTGQEFQFVDTNLDSIWKVQLLDNTWLSSFSSNNYDFSFDEFSANITYNLDITGGPMQVLIQYRIDEPYSGINMKIDVKMLETHSGIERVFFPYINKINGWANSTGNEEIAIPEREGWLITDAINSIVDRGYGASYPGTMSMQFFLLHESNVGGFYFASLDSNSRHKGIEIFSDTSNSIKVNWFHYSNNMMYHKGNNFTMDYWIVIDGYEGKTWATGVELYKLWALDQWYVQKGPVKDRDDVADWLKTIDYVWKAGSYVTDHNSGNIVLEGEKASNVGKFTSELENVGLSSNFLLEWWGWGRDGFDRGYPEYYPPKDGESDVIEAINSLHEQNSRVQLYFNGRLVDVTTDTYQNNLDYMTGFEDSKYTETYHPYFTAGVADPSSEWWQQIVSNFSTKAVRDLGADVVFLDQIAVAAPKFDYRDVLNHPPGSGSWWQQAQNKLLTDLRNELKLLNPDVAISSENILETYLNPLDIFWNYQTNYNYLAQWFPNGVSIPLFSQVYHKYTLFNGRSDVYPGDKNHFLWAVSEELLSGYIPGGGVLSLPSKHSISNTVYEFFKNAYETRKIGNHRFFRDGELLYPVTWVDSPVMTILAQGNSYEIDVGAIQAYEYAPNANDLEYGITFVNRYSSNINWNGDLKDLLFESGVDLDNFEEYTIQVYKNGIVEETLDFPSSSISLDLEPFEIVFLWLSKNDFQYTNSESSIISESIDSGKTENDFLTVNPWITTISLISVLFILRCKRKKQ